MKHILITGKNSYIGNNFEEWVSQWPEKYKVDKVSTRDGIWKKTDFSSYDSILHVAGLAHIKETKENRNLYYKVNRDLAVEVAKKAKKEGVKQFVFLSSMSVYGLTTGVIDQDTPLNPQNAYGQSKLEAEKIIKKMANDSFLVAIVRPPMVYGKKSKGNYGQLSKLAKVTPIFPEIENQRSMIYIDHLSEFIRNLIEQNNTGLYFPQNKEYVSTTEMVREISKHHSRNIWFTSLFNSIIKILVPRISFIGKIFGDLTYLKEKNSEKNESYSIYDFVKTIRMTEEKMNKVLILSNHHAYTYNFRREIIQELINKKYKVYVVMPYGEKVEKLKEMGVEHIDLDLDRRGINPFVDLRLIRGYYKIISEVNPDIVISYTVKPNIYGGFVTKIKGIPFYPNITGLGTALEDSGRLQKFIIKLYKFTMNKATCIFFQNKENQDFFIKEIFEPQNHRLIPGSGVNLNYFQVIEYPPDNKISFVFISRIMKEKGIDQYLQTANYILSKYDNVEFHVCGFVEGDYEETIQKYHEAGIIKYHGMVSDIREILRDTHCTIHPTYYPEGMSNVLLESLASGRPIITTNRSGTREIVDDKKNGFIIEPKDTSELIEAVESFIQLEQETRIKMGLNGRKKVETYFDRQLVVEAYMEELENRRDIVEL